MSTIDLTEVRTSLTDVEIAERVEEVNCYERFSVFSFQRAAAHSDHFLSEADFTITSADGSVYIGYTEDWDDSRYYVNLR